MNFNAAIAAPVGDADPKHRPIRQVQHPEQNGNHTDPLGYSFEVNFHAWWSRSRGRKYASDRSTAAGKYSEESTRRRSQNKAQLQPLLLECRIAARRLLRYLYRSRHLRRVPTAAESLDQRHGRGHLLDLKTV